MLSLKNLNFSIKFYKYIQVFVYEWFMFIRFLIRMKYYSKILAPVKVIIL